MNKYLLIVVILLIPITIISFRKETNFLLPKNEEIKVKIKGGTTIPLEEYVIGVVAGEMPASFEEEALKAQSIASRTYAMYYIDRELDINTNDQVYLTIDEMKEKWSDFDKYYNIIKNCVSETKGQIMTFKDKPIKAYYYSRSNGYTENSIEVFQENLEYIEVLETPFEELYENVITLSIEDFKKAFNIPSCDNITISDKEVNNSNRVSKIVINKKEYTGIEIRKLLKLKSTDFDIEIKDKVTITTRGYGHGVGMSQYGANSLAKQGYSHQEILKFYYKNIEITNI